MEVELKENHESRVSGCPTKEEWIAYLDEQNTSDVDAEMEEHVEACENCCLQLDAIDAERFPTPGWVKELPLDYEPEPC